MKRFLVLCLIAITTIACKNQEKPSGEVEPVSTVEVVEDKNTFKGEFIYLSDAAVLTTKNEIYAVRIDDKMHELNDLATPLKKTTFDMVNVVIKGEVVPNPLKLETGEGWEEMIIIKEIKEVTPASSAAVVAPI
ncbi:component of SufBCD complex [Nonlabens sp.]|uniref:component of SufBCD complex n=1 Tax=Nonlabens sp. TaxID=1888209 RepID=UPI003F6A152E